MIVAKINLGNDFKGLINYVLSVKKAVPKEHIATKNVINFNNIVTEMQVVAAQNNRVVNPVCHVILSWAAAENPTVKQQLEAGHKICKALKLDKHQFILVVHNEAKNGVVPGPDGRHFEMHIAANRVHPAGRVNKLFNSFKIAEIAAAQISMDMGFDVVPGRFNKMGTLSKPGLNPKIGSIRAQTGQLTIAEQLRADPKIINTLMVARNTDWHTFIQAFRSFDIAICVAREAHGKISGLSMVDLKNPDRKMALSNLENGTDNIKWGYGALTKDFGTIDNAMRLKLFPDTSYELKNSNKFEHTWPPRQQIDTTDKPKTPDYGKFKIELELAQKSRQVQVQEWHRLRQEIYEKCTRRKERRYAFKALRRNLLRTFFGRNSFVALAVNAYCDLDYNRDVKTILSQRTKELAELKDRHSNEIITIPRWVDWKRQVVNLEAANLKPSVQVHPDKQLVANKIPTHSRDQEVASMTAVRLKSVQKEVLKAKKSFKHYLSRAGQTKNISSALFHSEDKSHTPVGLTASKGQGIKITMKKGWEK